MIHGLDTGFLVAAAVREHADHDAAHDTLTRLLSAGIVIAIAPQVLAEFIHIVTDHRRFARPLDVAAARQLAERWWTAREAVRVFPDDAATRQFLAWLQQFSLGRKRLLDTLLAAIYQRAGISSLLTTNPADFRLLGFHLHHAQDIGHESLIRAARGDQPVPNSRYGRPLHSSHPLCPTSERVGTIPGRDRRASQTDRDGRRSRRVVTIESDPGRPRGALNAPTADVEREAVRESIRRDRPYGADGWVRGTARCLGLEWSLRPHGSPRSGSVSEIH